MDEEIQINRILGKAKIFKSRASKSFLDGSRHDIVMSDERKAHYTAHSKLGWSNAKIGATFDRDPVTIGRSIEKEQELLTGRKKYRQKIDDHFRQLSVTASLLALNLRRYRNNLGTVFRYTGKIMEGVVYGGSVYEIQSEQTASMATVDKSTALNLLLHLKSVFPELTDIKDWDELTIDQITDDFVERLGLEASRRDFVGKCPECPDR